MLVNIWRHHIHICTVRANFKYRSFSLCLAASLQDLQVLFVPVAIVPDRPPDCHWLCILCRWHCQPGYRVRQVPKLFRSVMSPPIRIHRLWPGLQNRDSSGSPNQSWHVVVMNANLKVNMPVCKCPQAQNWSRDDLRKHLESLQSKGASRPRLAVQRSTEAYG